MPAVPQNNEMLTALHEKGSKFLAKNTFNLISLLDSDRNPH